MSDIKLACTVVEQVKAICDIHGNTPGELINILHEAQHLYGYLPEEMQRIIAHKLNIPVSKVYGVVTFYTFFTMTPKGKHPISVCMGDCLLCKRFGKIIRRIQTYFRYRSRRDHTGWKVFIRLPPLCGSLWPCPRSDDRRESIWTPSTSRHKKDSG